jgi:hypothetical protein
LSDEVARRSSRIVAKFMLIVFGIREHLGAIRVLASPSQSFSFALIGAKIGWWRGASAGRKDQRRANG